MLSRSGSGVSESTLLMARKQRKGTSASFTPMIDKRIIEGFIGDREAMIKELTGEGIGRMDVLGRAEELGLTKQFISQCHVGGVDLAIRRCLRCSKEFVSMGPHNRLCRSCQAKH